MDEKNLKKVIEDGYKRRIRHFELEKKMYDIVIAGDSMAAYLNTHHYFKNISIMNQGIPGDTTEGLMKRLDYVFKVSPKKIFLNIGSNDLVLLHKKPIEIVESIISLIQRIKSELKEVKIYLFNVTPVNETVEYANHLYIFGRKNEDIIEINDLLNKRLPVDMLIDIYHEVVDEHEKLKPSLTNDGIHLNDLGYTIYAQLMKTHL
jgi:lysophospholipase L1-like esterase